MIYGSVWMAKATHWVCRYALALPLRGTSLWGGRPKRSDGPSPHPRPQSTNLHSLDLHQELSQTTPKQSPRPVQGSGPAQSLSPSAAQSRCKLFGQSNSKCNRIFAQQIPHGIPNENQLNLVNPAPYLGKIFKICLL